MKRCESCGSAVPDGAAFCPGCGVRLRAIDPVAYHDPEQAGDMLAEVVGEMGGAVRAFGGVVNQIMGDGIMALFGAPLAIEEHAAQACRAALAMRQSVREKLRNEVHIRVGIGSGEVVVRAMPGDVTLHYSAAGEAVHFASRMEQMAAPDQIVLTAATLALTGGLAAVRSLGPVPIKGLDAPMEVFELRAAGGRVRHAQRAQDRHRPVRRHQGLHRRWRSPRRCRIAGPATPPSWTCWPGCSSSLPKTTRRCAGTRCWPGSASAGEAEQQILPGIAALVGLLPAPGWQALEPRERRERTITASTLAMQEASRYRPMAVVIEDAHWLDPESADSLLRTRLRMHGAVLAALEEREGDDDADLLANHASRAEAWAKAVRYSRLAASRALDRYANPESARYYRQALAAVEHWPDGPEKEKTQLGLHIEIRWPLFRLGHVRDLLPHLEQAAGLASRYDDHVQLGQSHALRSHVLWLAGKPDEAEQAAEAAHALALAQGDRDLEIRALFQLALVHLTSGRVGEIVAALE